MIKKIALIGAIVIVLLGFVLYTFIYTPLIEEEEELIIQLGQAMNRLEDREEELDSIEELEAEYESILRQLEYEYAAQLSSSSEINNFIIELNSFAVVKDLDSTMGNNLEVELELLGDYEEIYDFIKEIDYIYDATDVVIIKEDEKVSMDVTLLFPVERGE